MLSYCLKFKKITESINLRVSKTSNGKTKLLSKCATFGSKKLRFIKEKEASGLLTNLGLKHHWSRFHYWVILYFKCNSVDFIMI